MLSRQNTVKMTGLTLVVVLSVFCHAAWSDPVWPPAPDQARVAFVAEIRCEDLGAEKGFLAKVGGFLGGADDTDRLVLPFGVCVYADRLFMVCQDFPALIRVDVEGGSYKAFRCDDNPLVAPIALAIYKEYLLVTDSGSGMVYRFKDGDLKPWLTTGLLRPTGLAVLPTGEVAVVDTGDQTIKVHDAEGNLTRTLAGRGGADTALNFPTYAVGTADGFLVNDTMNYRIKRLDAAGNLLAAFGEEGNGPGTFARPKGLAVDTAGHVWVVDSLFDELL